MDDAELLRRLDAIDAALTKIHIWQAERPSGDELSLRMEEILKIYGTSAQLLEVWRKQRPEIRALHRDVKKLHEVVAELERVIGEQKRAVGETNDER